MKLMTYNILNGGEKGLGLVEKTIQDQSPDFLNINEANTFREEKILSNFSKVIGMPHYEISFCGDGDDYHVAVFSKTPFREVVKIEPLMRAGILVVLDSALGEIAIVGTHLTPYSEALRLPEVEIIAKHLAKYERRILMGDLNSLSKKDGYAKGKIEEFNEAQIKKFTANGQILFDVTDKITKLGYNDMALHLGKNRQFTVPTSANEDIGHSQMRLDYYFVSENLVEKIKDYEVIKNEVTEKASDHYPVTLTI